jgi:hypothetical protein
LIQSKNLETGDGSENEKNRLVVMTEIVTDTEMGIATGIEILAIGEVTDTTIPAIEIEIDGMIQLTEIERGVVIDAMTLAAGQGGMIQGIGGPMKGIDDLMRGIDEEMIHLGNFFL